MRSSLVRSVLVAACLMMAGAALAQDIVAPATRNVTPPGVMPGPQGDGPLVREAVPPAPPEPPRWRRYFLPVTTDAATFSVRDGNLVIHIAGVTPPAADATCTFADGTAWPCGKSALFQFRLFLHGRAVECFFPYADQLTEVTAPCRIGETDLGLWLLKAGWAKANELSTDEYLAAVAAARCSAIGMWRGAKRPDYCPPAPAPAPMVDVAPDVPDAAPDGAPDVADAPDATASVPKPADSGRARFTDDLFR